MYFFYGRTSKLVPFVVACAAMVLPPTRSLAQNPELMQKLQEVKQASAANKVALSHFSWQEQQTISLKGSVKKTIISQVSTGLDGQQQKVVVSSLPAAAPPSGGRLKQRIVARKTDEYEQYGQAIGALTKQYTQPDPELLQQAYKQGNVSLQMGGSAGTISLIIKNYIKPGDSMTLVFNSATKSIMAMNVATYLTDPKDAVTMAVQFAKLPSGVNHVASTQVDGVSKQMTVAIQNSNYQPS
jgi:hypothetical protein